jgi:uncharacterized protein (TIGR00369 family)
MHLKFVLDEKNRRYVCRFRLSNRYLGPPGHAHGGIIATILDEAMSKANKLRQVVAMTAVMKIEFLKPVPLGELLIAEGRPVRARGRICLNAAEIRNSAGAVLARARGKFIVIDPERLSRMLK